VLYINANVWFLITGHFPSKQAYMLSNENADYRHAQNKKKGLEDL